MGKPEDDKENVADTNGIVDHGADDLTAGTTDAVERAPLEGEVSTQPLAAGEHDAEYRQKSH